MIDLYGQCVQISVYDEDYRGAQAVTTVPALLPETATATDDTPSKPCCELHICLLFSGFPNVHYLTCSFGEIIL